MAIGGVGFLNQINSTKANYNTVLKQVASGSKFPSAQYGTSEYAISRRTRAQIGALAQSNQNTQNANAMLSVAAGGVSSTISALTSIRDQVIKAANGTNSPSDIDTIGKSINQSIQTINDNASIQYNGMDLLNSGRDVAVAGVDGYRNVTLGNMTAESLGLADSEGNSTIDLTDLATYYDGKDYDGKDKVDTTKGLGKALSTIDNALGKALDEATNIGAAQQNLTFASANYTVSEENLTAADSNMSDTDMAKAITQLRSADTQNQLAMYAQKMFMTNSASVLSLLR